MEAAGRFAMGTAMAWLLSSKSHSGAELRIDLCEARVETGIPR